MLCTKRTIKFRREVRKLTQIVCSVSYYIYVRNFKSSKSCCYDLFQCRSDGIVSSEAEAEKVALVTSLREIKGIQTALAFYEETKRPNKMKEAAVE